MFQIGEHIIYPMRGAGTIKAVEEQEAFGKIQTYYIITMTLNGAQIMIPTHQIAQSNIRRITDIAELQNILHIFQHGQPYTLLPWRERYKQNTAKVKSGTLQNCAEVVRDLRHMQKEKPLNTSEKQMLAHAHTFLLNELVLIPGITENELNSFS